MEISRWAFRGDIPRVPRIRRVIVAGVVSAVAAGIVHEITLGDVEPEAWRFDGIGWASVAVLLPLLAPLCGYLATRGRESVPRYAMGVLPIPVLVLGIGLANADNRRWQLDARETFAAHTQRFPERLHGTFVPEQLYRDVVVCARDSRVPENGVYCLQIHVRDGPREDSVRRLPAH
ncbi:MAG: hypothetical protein LC808_23615 [Actinobacteria bacterium]|nr:hypothetical protein [Actinomycetota bacterium]